ncbi:hypothetical protein Trydic_g7535 [Trypoxylus dichotomus]
MFVNGDYKKPELITGDTTSAGRTWHSTLDNILKSYGAKPTTSNPCLYYMRKGRELILTATYVVIASSNPTDCIDLGRYLSTKFEVKDLGEIR